MPYKKMEAVLIEKVHQLREIEDELMRSYIQLQWNPCSATTAAVNLGFDLVDRQVCLIEGLMAEMDRAAPMASMLGSNNVVSPAYLV
jgi:sugar diacid utilization regulator